jgi:hypothetical protein
MTRNHARRGILAVTMLATIVAACGSAAPTSSPVVPPFAIRAAQVQPQACMEALLSGRLAQNAMTGLGVVSAGGQPMPVEWPFRYSARVDGGRVSLLDESGKVVAREGDEINVGGGFGNQVWFACGPVTVTRAAS